MCLADELPSGLSRGGSEEKASEVKEEIEAKDEVGIFVGIVDEMSAVASHESDGLEDVDTGGGERVGAFRSANSLLSEREIEDGGSDDRERDDAWLNCPVAHVCALETEGKAGTYQLTFLADRAKTGELTQSSPSTLVSSILSDWRLGSC